MDLNWIPCADLMVVENRGRGGPMESHFMTIAA